MILGSQILMESRACILDAEVQQLQCEHLHVRILAVFQTLHDGFHCFLPVVRTTIDTVGEIQVACHVRLAKGLRRAAERAATNQQAAIE